MSYFRSVYNNAFIYPAADYKPSSEWSNSTTVTEELQLSKIFCFPDFWIWSSYVSNSKQSCYIDSIKASTVASQYKYRVTYCFQANIISKNLIGNKLLELQQCTNKLFESKLSTVNDLLLTPLTIRSCLPYSSKTCRSIYQFKKVAPPDKIQLPPRI